MELLFQHESYKIIGACMEVHKKLGSGFLESVYTEALSLEFSKADILYSKEKKLPVYYDGQIMKKYPRWRGFVIRAEYENKVKKVFDWGGGKFL